MQIPVSDRILQGLVTEQTQAIREQTAVMRSLLELLQNLVRPPRPRNPHVTLVGEDHMADTLKYDVALDPLPAGSDVAKRRLKVTVDGVDRDPVEVDAGAAFPQLEVPQGSQVKLVFNDVDDATPENVSPDASFEFQALDTLPPNAPSGMSVTLVGETETP